MIFIKESFLRLRQHFNCPSNWLFQAAYTLFNKRSKYQNMPAKCVIKNEPFSKNLRKPVYLYFFVKGFNNKQSRGRIISNSIKGETSLVSYNN